MAHVHGAKMVEAAVQVAKGAGSRMMIGDMMGASTMDRAAEMGMGSMMNHRAMATGVAAATASAKKGKSIIMTTLSKHPLILFGVGVAVGYLVHKYRKEIIETATRAGEKGKDFVLQQRESLEDIMAGQKEAADDAGAS